MWRAGRDAVAVGQPPLKRARCSPSVADHSHQRSVSRTEASESDRRHSQQVALPRQSAHQGLGSSKPIGLVQARTQLHKPSARSALPSDSDDDDFQQPLAKRAAAHSKGAQRAAEVRAGQEASKRTLAEMQSSEGEESQSQV